MSDHRLDITLRTVLTAAWADAADAMTSAFGPLYARDLRRQAAKLTGEADAIDARVVEARTRLGVDRG